MAIFVQQRVLYSSIPLLDKEGLGAVDHTNSVQNFSNISQSENSTNPLFLKITILFATVILSAAKDILKMQEILHFFRDDSQ